VRRGSVGDVTSGVCFLRRSDRAGRRGQGWGSLPVSGTRPEALLGWEQQGDLSHLPERQRAVVETFLEEVAGREEITAVQVEPLEGGTLLVTAWAEHMTTAVLSAVGGGEAADRGAGVSFLAVSTARVPAPSFDTPRVLWLGRRLGGAIVPTMCR
jgi:hypothetical protein